MPDRPEFIDQEHWPMTELRDREIGTPQIVVTVDRKAQREALRSIDGAGHVEPDGWTEIDERPVPVVDGAPIAEVALSQPIKTKSRGVETVHTFAVKDVGYVVVSKSFAHPDNTSTVKVTSADD